MPQCFGSSFHRFLLILATVAISCSHSPAHGAEPVVLKAEADFLQLPDGWSLGACSAVAVNRRGEIFVFHRGEHPLLVFAADGKYLRSWGDDLIGSAHGLRIDADDNVWATDIGNHRVFKFDSQGTVLLSLGTGKPGDGLTEFNKPTDVAFGERGEFFVTDGYGNARVLKFSPSGALLQTWGNAGKERGQFRIPHSIVRDARGRLYVGDRENDRIQIFDVDGKLLDVWPGFAPYGLALDRDGTLFVADGRAHQLVQLDETGRVVQRFGKQGTGPGEFNLPHMFAIDAAGQLLVAEVNGRRVQKLQRE
jgi:DNA-binding beta-propeller fold protein YncE